MTVKNVVVTSTFTQNGETKKKYTQIGVLVQYDDGGMSLKLDTLPVNWDGSANIYDKKDK
jgi:hypothetical protein